MTQARSNIFISYRRGIDNDAAARLHDALRAGLSSKVNVFRDIDSKIELLGRDFLEVLRERIANSAVVFVVIGQGWLDQKSRLGDDTDVVRAEISLALQDPGSLVIPVLVGSAEIPVAADLPDSLNALPGRGGVRLVDDGYKAGLEALFDVVDEQIPGAKNPEEPAGGNRLPHRAGIVVPIAVLGALAIGLVYAAGIFSLSPSRVILMDSRLPEVVYDQLDRDKHNSNAKPIGELLDDLDDVVLSPYPTSLDFAEDERIMAQKPDVIVIHASAFYDKTREAQANARLISFIQAFAQEDTKFLIYSRAPIGPLVDFLHDANPEFQGRIDTLVVPVDGAESDSFRDPINARTLKTAVKELLNRESG